MLVVTQIFNLRVQTESLHHNMRFLSRYNLLVLIIAAPLLGEVALWIRSYFGNDYVFCRWISITDENGQSADLTSRTINQWCQSPGAKFQPRYLAVASRGGGVCFGLAKARYVVSEEYSPTISLLLLREQAYRITHSPRGRTIGTAHSASTEYPLAEQEPRLGFARQHQLQSSSNGYDVGYREHWALVAPHWFVFLLLLLPTTRLLIRFSRKSRWQARGCCLKCGYDLRATPGQCPECGPP